MKYKAEMWDKMQDVMEYYNDHMTHCYIQFDRNLNEKLLRKAFFIAINKVPILKSNFKTNFFSAYWKSINDFSMDDVFELRSANKDLLSESEEFLLKMLDSKNQAQIRILLLRLQNKDALSIIVNHQIMDGGDLKLFYKFVSSVYNNLLAGGDGNLPFKNGSRSDEQIYKAFTEEERKVVKSLISYSKKQKSRISFDFEKSKRSDQFAKINKKIVEKDMFFKIKSNAKKLGLSINDVILAGFFRVALDMINIEENDTLGIPNMVNLRRYIPGGESEGCCNLTSMVVVNIGNEIGKDIFETTKLCKEQMDKLKDNYPGLHGLSLLKSVFNLLPYSVAKMLIGKFFKNPLIGISNIGMVDEKDYVFGEAVVEDLFMTGSVKYPPYMQLALVTYKNAITFTIANFGTKKDHEMLQTALDKLYDELNVFAMANID